jgi:hypothetical protein
MLATRTVKLPKLTRSLKGITAKRANAMLSLTGKPFWQAESYDHLVRNEQEFQRIRRYIEENPVRAGWLRTQVSIDGQVRDGRLGGLPHNCEHR